MRALLLVVALGITSATVASRAPVTPAELDTLLAPIALYPDQLLAQMLICASKPGTLGTLAEWLRSHEKLEGSALQDAASAAGFEPSYVALVIFPDVVNSMRRTRTCSERGTRNTPFRICPRNRIAECSAATPTGAGRSGCPSMV